MNSPCLHYECTNRNSFGYCKTTACINYKYTKEWIESTTNCSPKAVFKPVTNADRIRAMTDEELCDEYFRILNHQLGNYTDSRLGLLGWLKEEVKYDI